MRDFQRPGRSMSLGTECAVSTSHPAASMAAIDAFRDGGNAADAAVAAAAVLGVVEPMSTGVGGDCHALLWRGGSPNAIGLDGAGWSPSRIDSDRLLGGDQAAIEPTSVDSVTIPGAVRAWERLAGEHGKLGLGRLLAPAIRLAEDGFAVHGRVAFDWQRSLPLLSSTGEARALLLAGGRAPREGDIFRMPALAGTMRAIATHGSGAFYRGAVAEKLVAFLKSRGGTHGLADFADYEANWVAPLSAGYKGTVVHEMPPSGQGITGLLILNILSGFDLASLASSSAARYHLEIEATRLAFQVRDHHVADPAFARIPLEELLSKPFAKSLRDRIHPDRAMTAEEALVPPIGDTVLVVAVDRDRNVCALINSLFYSFGSGLVCPSTGVIFQNRGCGFSLRPGHPNAIAPRKRALNTIIPAIASRGDRPLHAFGVIGAGYQPVGHAHVLANMIDFGMDPQAALDHPRCFFNAGNVECEATVPDAIIGKLAAMGHRTARAAVPIGSGHSVTIDWERGTLLAAADFRRDGVALAY